MLSLSVNTFKKYVRPSLKAVYVGGRTLYPTVELERWLDRHKA